MEEKKITYKLTDTGHWLARCDHSKNEIELNRREFFKLSPMYREYVWTHECVHLLYNVYDEAECNRITDEIFISKAKSEKERLERIKFIANSNDYGKSNWVAAVVCAAISLVSSVTSGIIQNRNSGYYSLSLEDRKTLVDGLLSEAFTASLLTDTQSAQDIFWESLLPNIPRKEEKKSFGKWVRENPWVEEYISKYEIQYGFAFDQITPIDEKRHPQYQKTMKIIGAFAMIVAVLILVIVIKKTKKQL